MLDTEKDVIAVNELETIIQRLDKIRQSASENIGKSQPILSGVEIDLIKDHLDLVKKYVAINSVSYAFPYQ